MPSKEEEEEENKLQKNRARQSQSQSNEPGAVASNATRTKAEENTRSASLPSELENLERSIAEKRRPKAAATVPGAFNAVENEDGRADLANLEADVVAKQRGRDASMSPLKKKMDSASKGSSRIGRDLDQLERDVNAKVQREGHAASQPKGSKKKQAPPPATPPSLDRLEQQIAAKQGSPAAELNEAERRIASKGGAESRTPYGLHQAEASVLNKKDEGGDASMLEMVDMGRKSGSNRLGALGDSHKFQDDLEYGEYGGPEEQGLAVAFAVDEEADDSYIPSAVEFDPDAKPPMVKNRRFRLYFILTVIVVVVACIGAAGGLTIAAKKTKQGIAYRETLGIREAAEKLVGKSVFEDNSSPYSKALAWVTHVDPKQMRPDDARFQQRFAAALFYYSTSVEGKWGAGCAEAATEEERSSFRCIFSYEEDGRLREEDSVRWLSEKDECSWYGLGCDEFGQLREVIFEFAANMTGTIPDIFFLFPYVQGVFIKNQHLTGTIPESLFKVPHLVSLDLSGNMLTGTLPETSFEESNIQRLILNSNELIGTLSSRIGWLTDLKTLTLFGNKMTGSIPTEIGLVRNLQFLRIGRNQFNGTLPSELGNMPSLADFSAQRLRLTGTIPTEIGNLKRLADIRLSHSKITGVIPEGLYNLTLLNRIDLQGNRLEGTISSSIGKLTRLMTLNLFGNLFTGTIPEVFVSFKRLNEVKIHGNRFDGTVPEGLCPSTRAAAEIDQVGKIVAECAEGPGGIIPNPCSCCTACCSDNGQTCVQENPPAPNYVENDEDSFLLNPV